VLFLQKIISSLTGGITRVTGGDIFPGPEGKKTY